MRERYRAPKDSDVQGWAPTVLAALLASFVIALLSA